MPTSGSDKSTTGLARALIVCLTLAVLYFAQDLLIPCTFAVLFAFILSPVVSKLVRARVPNALATMIVTLAAGLVVLAVLGAASYQAFDVVHRLPEYRENLVERIRSLRTTAQSPLANIQETVQTLKDEVANVAPPASSAATQPGEEPVRVEVVQSSAGPVDAATAFIGPIVTMAGMMAIVFVLTFFIVLSRDSIWFKLHRFSLKLGFFDAAESVDEVSLRVGRYLRMQFVVNTLHGVGVIGIAWLMGVPNPLMWGLLGGMLRYVPYIGPVVGIALPALLALAISTDWTTPMLTLALLLVLETMTNMVFEPLLYGNSTGVSTLGVVVSAVFWGWMWGGAGLLLGMPLTVALVVMGRYARPLRALSDFLSSDDETDVGPATVQSLAPAELEAEPIAIAPDIGASPSDAAAAR